MSRLGKKPIIIPEEVELHIEDGIVRVKGPKGEQELEVPPDFEISVKGNQVSVTPKVFNKFTRKMWGTLRSLLNNLIIGVKDGFVKKLEINGVGYKASVEGKNLILKIGYINPVTLPVPEGLEVSVEKNIITVSGLSKEKVGQFAAVIRSQRPVEPYKGKGIKYVDEEVRRKAGKKLAGTT
ncbi:50S ribosomal protein L6 [bacterium]|nr:50S ribosomal protein L6 [bacterium]